MGVRQMTVVMGDRALLLHGCAAEKPILLGSFGVQNLVQCEL